MPLALVSCTHLGGGSLRGSGLALSCEGPVIVALRGLGCLLLLDLLLLLLLDLVLVQLRGGVPAAVDLRDGKVPGGLRCTHTRSQGHTGCDRCYVKNFSIAIRSASGSSLGRQT